MTDSARIRLFQLAAETACLIATADDPALARQQFMDDLTGELLLGAVNLAGSARLLEAFRDAMGYSVRVDAEDVLGERDVFEVRPGGVGPAATPSAIRKDAGPSRSPSALRVVEGGNTR